MLLGIVFWLRAKMLNCTNIVFLIAKVNPETYWPCEKAYRLSIKCEFDISVDCTKSEDYI